MNRLSLAPLPGKIYRADLGITDVKARKFHPELQFRASATESTSRLGDRQLASDDREHEPVLVFNRENRRTCHESLTSRGARH